MDYCPECGCNLNEEVQKIKQKVNALYEERYPQSEQSDTDLLATVGGVVLCVAMIASVIWVATSLGNLASALALLAIGIVLMNVAVMIDAKRTRRERLAKRQIAEEFGYSKRVSEQLFPVQQPGK